MFFISLYKGYATAAYSILFCEILGISNADVMATFIAGVLVLCVIAAIYRPLLFASLDEDVAEARGVPVLALGTIFMLVIAVTTSISVQVVGVLLIFALMVTPAAIAGRLTRRPAQGVAVSVSVARVVTWFGLFLSYYLPYPVSFFITTSVFILYLLTRIAQGNRT